MANPAKNTICLWYDGDAEDAARFYAKTFPDSSVGAVFRAPGDFPSGKNGDVLTVELVAIREYANTRIRISYLVAHATAGAPPHPQAQDPRDEIAVLHPHQRRRRGDLLSI